MKDQLALLRELQNIDLKLDELTTAQDEIQSRLDENREVLNRLVDDLENQREELEEIRALRSQRANDLQELKENLKERKKRLLSVGSAKEYNAVEKEIEGLQKSVEATEEELLKLAEVLEQNESNIAAKELMTTELGESIKAEEKSAKKEIDEYNDKIDALKARTEEARGEVNKRIIYKYDFIRSRRPGTAICAAENGHCTACHMTLPPQLFIQVQRGETLETCPSCQRILYFDETADAEVAESA